jgi:phage FluMu gp28-like protein
VNLSKLPKVSEELAYLVEYVDPEIATGIKGSTWERHQIEFFNDRNILTIDVKSRQIGWSFNAAMLAYARSVTRPNTLSIFLSVTQSEANEKIRYLEQAYEATDKDVRIGKGATDNKTEIEFSNGSRVISHPCRPPRGRARADVYVDEMAHYPKDDIIYTALVPIITRGGSIRIGSSPLGAQGKFWEIYTESLQRYPGYVRRSIPWWHVEGLCKDVDMAKKVAQGLSTPNRVETFGNDRLKWIFENMALPDFQQEYECDWADESVSWLSWEEIKRNQERALLDNWDCPMIQIDPYTDYEEVFKQIDALAHRLSNNKSLDFICGGFDIGRRKNSSELVLIAEENEKCFPMILGITLDRIEFQDQKDILRYVINNLGVESLKVDSGGLGMQLAEELENEFSDVVEGVNFSTESKNEWATSIKVKMQGGMTPIPLDRDFSVQLHSIKKKLTASKRIVFDVEGTKHHADKFWAFALGHSCFDSVEQSGSGDYQFKNYRG